jgi:hypothetical protein
MANPCRKTGRKRTVGIFESGASTQSSRFIPFTDKVSVNFGYSVSVVQGVVLTVRFAGHRRQLAGGLRASTIGGIDLLARLVMVGELKFTFSQLTCR